MLRLESLRVGIDGIEILRDIHLELPSRSVIALVGRNGAGKTTTLRAIMGLVEARAGRILLDAEDLTGAPTHERVRRGIGYAPEDRQLVPEFTVEENILLPCFALGLNARETRSRLDLVYAVIPELTLMRQQHAARLSGGQGKMVALGRALAAGRRLVLLDEPFQGLAPALAASYANSLARLRQIEPELGMLITESSAALLATLADKTLYLERGEIQEEPLSDAEAVPLSR